MNMYNIRIMETCLEQSDKGVYDGLKAFAAWSKTINKLNSPPLIYLFCYIRVSSTEKNIVSFGDNTREKLLAVFFHTSRDIWNTSRTNYKYFHGDIDAVASWGSEMAKIWPASLTSRVFLTLEFDTVLSSQQDQGKCSVPCF